MRAWVQALRPLAQANLFFPLLYGQALAFAVAGAFAWSGFGLALAFGLLDHAFIVLMNDVADEAADRFGATKTLVSGGSRVLVEGRLSRRAMRRAGVTAGAALPLLGAWQLARGQGPWVLVGAALAVALLWAYSFPPLRLSYRGHGEWLQAAGVGAVLPAVGFALQAGSLHGLPVEALLPSVALGHAGNLLTSLPDFEGDRAAAKGSHPVRTSPAHTRSVALATSIGATLAAPSLLRASVGSAPGWLWYVPGALLAVAALAWARADGADTRRWLPYVVVTAGLGSAALATWSALLFRGCSSLGNG